MDITVIGVGKIREKPFRQALDHYRNRIAERNRLNLVEIADEKAPAELSAANEEMVRQTEGKRIIGRIPVGAVVITLEIEGRAMDSDKLSRRMKDLSLGGSRPICFVIGGSLGLSKEVKSISDLAVSFSPMTFPHQLMRVILLEQLDRILSGG